MGCGGDFVAGTETDAFVQGAWGEATQFNVTEDFPTVLPSVGDDEYIIAISAGQLTVRYGDLIIPFRTEFDYATSGRFIDLSGIADLGDLDDEDAALIIDQLGFDPLDTFVDLDGDLADEPEEILQQIFQAGHTRAVAGYLTLFRYEDNLELATITIIVSLDPDRHDGNKDGKLAVFHVEPAEDVWYIEQYPIPKVGVYTELNYQWDGNT